MKPEHKIQFRRLIDLRTDLDKLEDKSVDSMLSIFAKAERDLKKTINKTKGFTTKKDQRKLLRELKKAHKNLSRLVTQSLSEGAGKVGEDALDGMTNILSWDGLDPDYNIPLDRAAGIARAIEMVPIGGMLLTDWVDKAFDETLQIQRNVLASSLKGEGYRKMTKALQNVYPMFTRRELITLARTYNQSVVVAAQEKQFEENRDVIKRVRWTAVMEVGFKSSGRGTCPRCAALDGQEYEWEDPKPYCPLHPRCRCMWQPVTKTWTELLAENRIVDKNGNPLEVPELRKRYRHFTHRKESNIDAGRGAGNVLDVEWTGGTFADFATKAGNNKVLVSTVGPKRAKMIQEGKVKFEDLVNRETGELFTLKELGYIKPPKKPPVKKSGPPPPVTPPLPELTKTRPNMGTIRDKLKALPVNTKLLKRLEDLNAEKTEMYKGIPTFKTLEEAQDYSKRLTDLELLIVELENEFKLTKETALKELITPPKGGKINYEFERGLTRLNQNADKVQRAFNTIEDMLHPDLIARLPDVKVWYRHNSRAHYKLGRNIMRMGNFRDDIWLHEYGHHIEWNANLYPRALDFRNSRTVGEYVTQIGNTGEYGYKDEFFNHYVGRKYTFDGTEIISMGIQQMYNKPVQFYETDPDFFEFILKIMWGE